MHFIIGPLVAIPVVATIISFIMNIVLAGLLAISYTTLTRETPIAKITFTKNAPQEYVATLRDAEDDGIGEYTIYGDQWQLDAAFYKIAYFANMLGAESKYTLDRFKGRYKNINDANNKQSKAYRLESHDLIDTFSFFFDTSYGSSTYKDIHLNTLYTVYKTPTGIMVRTEPTPIKKKEDYLSKAKALIGL